MKPEIKKEYKAPKIKRIELLRQVDLLVASSGGQGPGQDVIDFVVN